MTQQRILRSRCYSEGYSSQGWLNASPCLNGIYIWSYYLLQPPFTFAEDNPTDRKLDLKWRTPKTCFLLSLTTARRRSFLHALSVAPSHITFGWRCGRAVHSQPITGTRISWKDQLSSQVPLWVQVLGIDHLNPNDSQRMLCPVRQQYGGGEPVGSWHLSEYQSHISRWIVKVMNEDVLSAAFWCSSEVSQWNYLRDLAPIAGIIAMLGAVVAAQHICGY